MGNLFIISPRNKIYNNALEREIQIWKKLSNGRIHKSLELHPVVLRYINEKITGMPSDKETFWIDYLIKRYEPVQRALSLGSGTGRYEKIFIKKGFINHIDTIDICLPYNDIWTNLPESKHTHFTADLNFIKLPEKQYELILSKGILHHIINLEHLLNEINNALTNNGIFIVHEYVGERKQQWSNEKIKRINKKLLNKFQDKYPNLKIFRRPFLNLVPFEAVRSSAIPGLIKEYFGNNIELEVTFGSALYPVINSLAALVEKINIDNCSIEEILKYGVELDKEFRLNYKYLLPCYLFAICQKSNIHPVISTIPWTKREVELNISLHLPFLQKAKLYLRKSFLLRKIYRFFKDLFFYI
ncbi:MAG: class I SAM-dependent methyltransferase [Candidatus Helarchaeota archaeon]